MEPVAMIPSPLHGKLETATKDTPEDGTHSRKVHSGGLSLLLIHGLAGLMAVLDGLLELNQ